MLVERGGAAGRRGFPPNCTGAATSLKGVPPAVSQSCMYPLATLCGSTAHSRVSCTTHHWPVKSARRSLHSPTVRSAKASSSSSCASMLCSSSAAWSAKRGSVPSSTRPTAWQSSAQYRLAWRQQKERARSSLVS